MNIALIVEGKTEKSFLPYLRKYLQLQLQGNMPKIKGTPYDGRIPTGDKLKRVVMNLLSGHNPCDHVIALTDIYTGSQPPDFQDATDAKNKMRLWVGNEKRFHPHAAQYDFEAWLLPYWQTIQRLAGHNMSSPASNPEIVNHIKPPADYIKEIFRKGSSRDHYVKTRDAGRILRENNLSVAVSQCSELRAFVNTIISVSGGVII